MIEARGSYTSRTIMLPGIHPRAELLKKLDAKHAEKIFRDKKDGRTVHVGYIVRGEWYTFYNVTLREKEA